MPYISLPNWLSLAERKGVGTAAPEVEAVLVSTAYKLLLPGLCLLCCWERPCLAGKAPDHTLPSTSAALELH